MLVTPAPTGARFGDVTLGNDNTIAMPKAFSKGNRSPLFSSKNEAQKTAASLEQLGRDSDIE